MTLITVLEHLTPSRLPWAPGTLVVYILTSRYITYNITNLNDNNENKQPKFLETDRLAHCVEDQKVPLPVCAGVFLSWRGESKLPVCRSCCHIKTPVVLSKIALKYFSLLVILHSSFLSFPASLLL